MLYTIVSKPRPLTQTAIAYECDIYEQPDGYAAGRPWIIGNAYVQVNKYGDFDCDIHYEKFPEEAETALKQIKKHCMERSKIVFRTEEKQKP